MSHREMTEQGIQVLVDREGLRTKAYYDSVGVLTIGVGHTSAAGPPKVVEGMTITEEEAFAIFDTDNDYFEKVVIDTVTVDLTDWEFDALVSFVFNIGETQWRSSTMLKKLNEGDKAGAFEQFKQWKKPPEIIPRRRGEAACFGYNLYVARIEDDSDLLGDYKSGELGPPIVEEAEEVEEEGEFVEEGSIVVLAPPGIRVIVNGKVVTE